MERLQVKMVDLNYLHRISDAEIEEIAKAMGKFIKEGLIRGWGLSYDDIDLITEAQNITPLSVIRNIYSLIERDSEENIIPYCIKNNIGFVPFSPMTSFWKNYNFSLIRKKMNDVRNWVPQLKKENIEGNKPIIDLIQKFAQKKTNYSCSNFS